MRNLITPVTVLFRSGAHCSTHRLDARNRRLIPIVVETTKKIFAQFSLQNQKRNFLTARVSDFSARHEEVCSDFNLLGAG